MKSSNEVSFKKKAAAYAAVLLLTGCSTTLTDRQIEAMHTPTLTLNCETGCSASYTDPRDRPKLPTNGWDTANVAINAAAGVATSVAPWAAIGLTAVEGLSQAGDRDSSSTVTTDTASTTTTTATSSDSRQWNETTDTTHTPTVVTQPAPMVVTQPDPVIVPSEGATQ